MDIKGIVRSVGMDTDPSGYSNRGATTSDLNCNILSKIADAIEKNYGIEALNSFVAMVWQMEVLSATAFLSNLYYLEKLSWDISRITLTNSDNKIENEAGAFHHVVSVICRAPTNDETKMIRRGFRKQ